MRKLTCLTVLITCHLLISSLSRAEEDVEIDAMMHGESRPILQYLQEIDQIEMRAAQAKAEARARLLNALGRQRATRQEEPQKTTPGLIGTAIVDGQQSGVAFHYEHGQLFRRELVWDRFHKQVEGKTQFPDLNITLVGYVEVPHEMTVKISQAAGGVNGDHGTLFVGDRQLGQVGDDTAKAEVYLLTLPAGTHPIRWVLTGGTFQNSLLKLEDPRTGELLRVFSDESQRRKTGADQASEGLEAGDDPSEWVQAMGPHHWRWVPLGN